MRQLALDLAHRPAIGRSDFLVADSNAVAVEWIDRWPDWPGVGLALHGPAGAGKSHLASVFRERSGARNLAAESLTLAEPPNLLDEATACVIDDLDQTALQDAATQRGLLHLFNLLAERRGSLLLIGREPPARWALTLADLRSRLVTLPAVALGAPDDALLRAVLIKLFADRQLTIAEPVLQFLTARMERSFAAARALVEALDQAALSGHRTLTVPLARETLAELEAASGAAEEPRKDI